MERLHAMVQNQVMVALKAMDEVMVPEHYLDTISITQSVMDIDLTVYSIIIDMSHGHIIDIAVVSETQSWGILRA